MTRRSGPTLDPIHEGHTPNYDGQTPSFSSTDPAFNDSSRYNMSTRSTTRSPGNAKGGRISERKRSSEGEGKTRGNRSIPNSGPGNGTGGRTSARTSATRSSEKNNYAVQKLSEKVPSPTDASTVSKNHLTGSYAQHYHQKKRFLEEKEKTFAEGIAMVRQYSTNNATSPQEIENRLYKLQQELYAHKLNRQPSRFTQNIVKGIPKSSPPSTDALRRPLLASRSKSTGTRGNTCTYYTYGLAELGMPRAGRTSASKSIGKPTASATVGSNNQIGRSPKDVTSSIGTTGAVVDGSLQALDINATLVSSVGRNSIGADPTGVVATADQISVNGVPVKSTSFSTTGTGPSVTAINTVNVASVSSASAGISMSNAYTGSISMPTRRANTLEPERGDLKSIRKSAGKTVSQPIGGLDVSQIAKTFSNPITTMFQTIAPSSLLSSAGSSTVPISETPDNAQDPNQEKARSQERDETHGSELNYIVLDLDSDSSLPQSKYSKDTRESLSPDGSTGNLMIGGGSGRMNGNNLDTTNSLTSLISPIETIVTPGGGTSSGGGTLSSGMPGHKAHLTTKDIHEDALSKLSNSNPLLYHQIFMKKTHKEATKVKSNTISVERVFGRGVDSPPKSPRSLRSSPRTDKSDLNRSSDNNEKKLTPGCSLDTKNDLREPRMKEANAIDEKTQVETPAETIVRTATGAVIASMTRAHPIPISRVGSRAIEDGDGSAGTFPGGSAVDDNGTTQTAGGILSTFLGLVDGFATSHESSKANTREASPEREANREREAGPERDADGKIVPGSPRRERGGGEHQTPGSQPLEKPSLPPGSQHQALASAAESHQVDQRQEYLAQSIDIDGGLLGSEGMTEGMTTSKSVSSGTPDELGGGDGVQTQVSHGGHDAHAVHGTHDTSFHSFPGSNTLNSSQALTPRYDYFTPAKGFSQSLQDGSLRDFNSDNLRNGVGSLEKDGIPALEGGSDFKDHFDHDSGGAPSRGGSKRDRKKIRRASTATHFADGTPKYETQDIHLAHERLAAYSPRNARRSGMFSVLMSVLGSSHRLGENCLKITESSIGDSTARSHKTCRDDAEVLDHLQGDEEGEEEEDGTSTSNDEQILIHHMSHARKNGHHVVGRDKSHPHSPTHSAPKTPDGLTGLAKSPIFDKGNERRGRGRSPRKKSTTSESKRSDRKRKRSGPADKKIDPQADPVRSSPNKKRGRGQSEMNRDQNRLVHSHDDEFHQRSPIIDPAHPEHRSARREYRRHLKSKLKSESITVPSKAQMLQQLDRFSPSPGGGLRHVDSRSNTSDEPDMDHTDGNTLEGMAFRNERFFDHLGISPIEGAVSPVEFAGVLSPFDDDRHVDPTTLRSPKHYHHMDHYSKRERSPPPGRSADIVRREVKSGKHEDLTDPGIEGQKPSPTKSGGRAQLRDAIAGKSKFSPGPRKVLSDTVQQSGAAQQVKKQRATNQSGRDTTTRATEEDSVVEEEEDRDTFDHENPLSDKKGQNKKDKTEQQDNDSEDSPRVRITLKSISNLSSVVGVSGSKVWDEKTGTYKDISDGTSQNMNGGALVSNNIIAGGASISGSKTFDPSQYGFGPFGSSNRSGSRWDRTGNMGLRSPDDLIEYDDYIGILLNESKRQQQQFSTGGVGQKLLGSMLGVHAAGGISSGSPNPTSLTDLQKHFDRKSKKRSKLSFLGCFRGKKQNDKDPPDVNLTSKYSGSTLESGTNYLGGLSSYDDLPNRGDLQNAIRPSTSTTISNTMSSNAGVNGPNKRSVGFNVTKSRFCFSINDPLKRALHGERALLWDLVQTPYTPETNRVHFRVLGTIYLKLIESGTKNLVTTSVASGTGMSSPRVRNELVASKNELIADEKNKLKNNLHSNKLKNNLREDGGVVCGGSGYNGPDSDILKKKTILSEITDYSESTSLRAGQLENTTFRPINEHINDEDSFLLKKLMSGSSGFYQKLQDQQQMNAAQGNQPYQKLQDQQQMNAAKGNQPYQKLQDQRQGVNIGDKQLPPQYNEQLYLLQEPILNTGNQHQKHPSVQKVVSINENRNGEPDPVTSGQLRTHKRHLSAPSATGLRSKTLDEVEGDEMVEGDHAKVQQTTLENSKNKTPRPTSPHKTPLQISPARRPVTELLQDYYSGKSREERREERLASRVGAEEKRSGSREGLLSANLHLKKGLLSGNRHLNRGQRMLKEGTHNAGNAASISRSPFTKNASSLPGSSFPGSADRTESFPTSLGTTRKSSPTTQNASPFTVGASPLTLSLVPGSGGGHADPNCTDQFIEFRGEFNILDRIKQHGHESRERRKRDAKRNHDNSSLLLEGEHFKQNPTFKSSPTNGVTSQFSSTSHSTTSDSEIDDCVTTRVCSTPFPALHGPHWESIGLQGLNPCTDINRFGGISNLLHLLHFLTRNSETLKRIWRKSRDPIHEFPLICTSIQFSKLVLDITFDITFNKNSIFKTARKKYLKWCNKRYLELCKAGFYQAVGVVSNNHNHNHVNHDRNRVNNSKTSNLNHLIVFFDCSCSFHNALLWKFWRIWSERKCTIADFNVVFQEIQKLALKNTLALIHEYSWDGKRY